mmetsp:Transcript_24489/g.30084  ORF Transcript_24489/g.30084 Transcript_24489/m.30084 type:complete len:345 (+) Transcript_24489:35-1069(+)
MINGNRDVRHVTFLPQILVLCCFLAQCHGFGPSLSVLPPMVLGNLLGKNNPSNQGEPTLPRDVKDAVSKCRESVQSALSDRLSRMEVELPVGASFGVEKSSQSKKQTEGGVDGVSLEVLQQSNRELCRIFVDMFGPVGGENICSVFMEESLADVARKKWKGDSSAYCQIASLNKSKQKKNKAKKKNMGFAAKLNSELGATGSSGKFALPANCEVALFVAPGPRELPLIESLCADVGMGTLVIILNARREQMDATTQTMLLEFTPVFHLAAAPQDAAPNCLVYHAYPNPTWLLARKPKVGQPKVIGSSDVRFDRDDVTDLFEKMDVGDVEVAVEGVLNNVASWFS